MSIDYNENPQCNIIESALAAGMKMANVINSDLEDIPYIAHHKDTIIKFFPEYRLNPTRLKALINTFSPDSFLNYFNRFATSKSAIFADPQKNQVLGIIDYHTGADMADWCDHRVVYAAPLTPEWQEWKDKNSKGMSQIDFAEFIEAHLPDIVEPDGAKLLEICTNLQAKINVDFQSAVAMENGSRKLVFNEIIDGKAGKAGELQIPTQMELGLRLFQGGERISITALFRSRIRQGVLTMGYQLLRPERIEFAAFETIMNQIHDGMTTGFFIQGIPS